jgi:hypothetical protein
MRETGWIQSTDPKMQDLKMIRPMGWLWKIQARMMADWELSCRQMQSSMMPSYPGMRVALRSLAKWS